MSGSGLGSSVRYATTRGYRMLAAAVGAALVLALGAQASTAASPVWEPVVQGAASGPWGPLEDEAVALLQADGYTPEAARRFLPGQIRAYVFARLLEIANMPAADRDADPVDKAAFDKLEQLLTQERHWTAVNALAKFKSYKTEQLNCPSSSSPTFPGTSVACAFSKMFGKTPSGAAFAAAGYVETFHNLASGPPATAAADMVDNVAFWQGLELPEGSEPPEIFQLGELKDVLKDKMSEASREFVQEAITGLVKGLAEGEIEADGLVTMGVAAAVILGYGIWNAFEVGATESELTKAVSDTDPATHTADVTEAASTPPGISELLFIVLSQTLAPDGAVLAGSGPACTFNNTLTCQAYRFASDPAFVDARYADPPPDRTSADAQFLVRKRGDATGTILPTVEPEAKPSDAITCPANTRNGVLPWGTGNEFGATVVRDSTSVRWNGDPSSQPPAGDPTSAEIRNGMFMQRELGCGRTPNDSTWLHHTGLKYVNWAGEWWTAWLHGNTFLHTKTAEPIYGTVTPGYVTRHGGIVGCTENPSPVALFPTLYAVVGPDCLFGQDGATFSNLSPGDRVIVDGQTRIVKNVESCIHIDWVFAYFKDPGGCTTYGKKAVELEPGLTVSWEAFNWTDTLYDFLEFPRGAPMGENDRAAVKLVALNTCKGRAGCTTGTDLANCEVVGTTSSDCFTSPAIEYKTGGHVEDWSATLVQPVDAVGVDLTAQENSTFTGPVASFTDPAGTGAISNYTASVDWGDGTVTAGTVALAGTTYTVTGTHKYAEEGTYTVTTSIGHSGVTAVATSTATVTDPAVVVTGTPVAAVEGAPLTTTTATFTDPAGPEPIPGNYSATIDWGDGTSPSPGTVAIAGSTFTVTGTHTYAEEGDFTVTTTVDHEGVLSTATSAASVQDAPLTVTAAAQPVSPQSFAGITATFTDADPNGTVSDYTATIDWGDGTTSVGVVDGGPVFNVKATHTYTSTGTYAITTTVRDHGPSTSVTSKVLVFAFSPGGGAFVIGDHNNTPGAVVTFWSDQWGKANTLTAGAAPSGFKGFASTPASVTLGQMWSTRTGNSPPPPTPPLPAYMGVIVADSVTQNGSTITGDTPHIAVVATRPGYAPSPGHNGTGTVVAQYR